MIDAIRSHFGKAWKLSGAVSRGFPDGGASDTTAWPPASAPW